MIHLEGIHKTYAGAQPLHVLKGIDLDIAEGELVSIMGASGSGKSTLLNILGILDDYDEGDYYLAGTLIKNLSETRAAEYRNRMIGFIFQSFNLIGFKTAVENVELPLFYQGVGRRRRHEMAMEELEKMGLTDWDVWRSATARSYSPSTRYTSKDYSRRRTHRSSGFQDGRRGYGAAETAEPRRAHHHDHSHSRSLGGRTDQ